MALAQRQLPSETEFKKEYKPAASGLIPFWVKHFWIHRLWYPLEALLVALKVSPNQITVFGAVMALGSIAIIAAGHLIVGSLLMFFFCSLDFMDGQIARRQNLSSKAGGFLDSVLDRYVDFALIAAFAILLSGHPSIWMVALAFLGTTTTPYIRAKAESMGLECRSGFMQRPERILILGLAILCQGLAARLYAVDGPWFLVAGISLVAILSNWSAAQRGVECFRRLQAIDKSKKNTPL